MKSFVAKVLTGIAVAGLPGAMCLVPEDAFAQQRSAAAAGHSPSSGPGASRSTGPSSGARTPSPGVRSQTPGVRNQAPGVRSQTPGVRPQTGSVRGTTGYRGPRVGVVIGAPIIASPWWYYNDPYVQPYYYGYDPYYDPPAVYLEQQAPLPVPPPQYWYYCEASQTYFPYVQTCATPWQRVIPHAPQ